MDAKGKKNKIQSSKITIFWALDFFSMTTWEPETALFDSRTDTGIFLVPLPQNWHQRDLENKGKTPMFTSGVLLNAKTAEDAQEGLRWQQTRSWNPAWGVLSTVTCLGMELPSIPALHTPGSINSARSHPHHPVTQTSPCLWEIPSTATGTALPHSPVLLFSQGTTQGER